MVLLANVHPPILGIGGELSRVRLDSPPLFLQSATMIFIKDNEDLKKRPLHPLVKAGVFIAVSCPLVFGVLTGLSLLIPGCVIGGSGGPAFGCQVLGISFNWLISWATPAFVFSFFSIPIGVLVGVVGSFLQGK